MNRPKRAAILFVHGILGTPRHFAPFLPYVPANWSVCNLLLEGHGGSVRDFSHAAMAQWKQQVHAALDALLTEHDRVLITAHSMGTLFAIQEALQRPVTELFLLNPPLNVRVTARLFKTVWTVFRGKAAPQDAWMLAAQNAYSIEKDRHVLRYIGWIPRYLELFAEIRKTRRVVRNLTVPSHIYLSLHDELVSPRSRSFFDGSSLAKVTMLNTSGHFYTSPEDQALLIEDFKAMVARTEREMQTAAPRDEQ